MSQFQVKCNLRNANGCRCVGPEQKEDRGEVTNPTLISLRLAPTDQLRTCALTAGPRLHSSRLLGAVRTDWRAAVNGVTSRRWRQRVCESMSSRPCTVLQLARCQFITCQGSVQGVMRNVHSCENKKSGKHKMRGETWIVGPDVDKDCKNPVASRGIRHVLRP